MKKRPLSVCGQEVRSKHLAGGTSLPLRDRISIKVKGNTRWLPPACNATLLEQG